MRIFAFIWILLLSNFCYSEIDSATGLDIAPGWELIRMHCGACHSYKLVTSQKADRKGWYKMIKWMQETQNLWTFDVVTEEGILNYLSTSYSPSQWKRRAPLDKSLMPRENQGDK